ncbi:MAG TPA: pantoate--beta-alanine ligase [Chthoniobacteraceae bacterium]|nr:pantoate--beta-alanine ligase [Chthoniobacteraceae bacterium]
MKIIRSVSGMSRTARQLSPPIVVVPTMGALHAGHAALLVTGRKQAGPSGTLVTTIFVNPTQFAPGEDYARYPRSFGDDRRLCAAHDVDILFHPEAGDIYPPGFSTTVHERAVSGRLCGISRPGHFDGVCTVVLKLFEITAADIAVFGLKDFQQCSVIRRMVRDLNLPVRLRFVPTVRERDGLALSSRNRYLSPDERAQAPVLRRALKAAMAAYADGERNAAALRRILHDTIGQAPLARIDYAEVVDADSLQPAQRAGANTLLAAAVFFGRTRLIDNQWLRR